MLLKRIAFKLKLVRSLQIILNAFSEIVDIISKNNQNSELCSGKLFSIPLNPAGYLTVYFLSFKKSTVS